MAPNPFPAAQQFLDQEQYVDALNALGPASWADPEAYRIASYALFGLKDYVGAEQMARDGLKPFAPHAELQYALARALFKQKKYAEANQECDAIRAMDSTHGRACFLQAEILRQESRYVDALRRYAEVLTVSSQFATIETPKIAGSLFHGWGTCQFMLRRYADARENYERATKLRPEHSIWWNNLAATELALGRWHESVEHYRTAVACAPNYVYAVKGLPGALSRAGLTNEADTQFEVALGTEPKDLWVPVTYATHLWRRGRYREAKRVACELRDRYRAQRDKLEKEERNEDFADAAQIFATMLDDFELAEDAFRHATIKGQNPVVCADLAITEASILFERCERDPHPPRALRERAAAACRSAIFTMQAYLAGGPKDAVPIDAEQELLGRAYLLLGDFAQAKTYLMRMQRHEQALETLLARTLTAIELKDYPEAIVTAEMALVRDPDDVANRVLFAEALLLGGELEKCESEIRDVLQRAPGTVEAHQILAKVLIEQAEKGDVDLYGQAIAEMDLAWSLAGNANASKAASPALAAAVHYFRGFARSRIYDDPKLTKDDSVILAARDDFRRCLAADSQNHRAAIALRKIEERLRPRNAGWVPDRVAAALCGLIALAIIGTAMFAVGGGYLSEGYGVLFIFGALLFLIASFYLPHLSKLKVAGIELEKSAIDSSVSKVPLQIRKAPMQ